MTTLKEAIFNSLLKKTTVPSTHLSILQIKSYHIKEVHSPIEEGMPTELT